MFLTELKWCGRIISQEGVQYDPRNASGLENCASPINAGELCQYIHCIGWMQKAIPDHARRTSQLRDLLEKAYAKSGHRTKRSIKNIPLTTLGWTDEHEATFHGLQRTLREHLKLAHRQPDLALCIYTDASDKFWAGIVTQCEPSELHKAAHEQIHQPLAFISAEFTGAELAWTTFEKEGYVITQTFSRVD